MCLSSRLPLRFVHDSQIADVLLWLFPKEARRGQHLAWVREIKVKHSQNPLSSQGCGAPTQGLVPAVSLPAMEVRCLDSQPSWASQ